MFKNILKRKSSREIARDRLKILLISDRVNCSSEMMEILKNEGRTLKNPTLYANIPIIDLKQ